jgi:nicotinate phosphoribosyltransferase
MEEMLMAAPRSWVDYADLGLFTDLYELTMLQAYVERGRDQTATFSLFVRRLPERRNYLLACGLDDVLRYFECLRSATTASQGMIPASDLLDDGL